MASYYKEILKRERAIGRKAAKMAEQYVLGLIQQKLRTGESIHSPKIKPLLKATKVRMRMGEYRLLGLNFTSSKVGFIQHYGFSGIRAATTVMLSASRYNEAATTRKSSPMNLQPQNLFEDIYTKSGALDFLLESLRETRTDAVMAKIEGLILNLNSEEDGA